jgi:regulator of RNase E activity RraA
MFDELCPFPTATICDAYVRLGIRTLEEIVLSRIQPLPGQRRRAVGRARTQRLTASATVAAQPARKHQFELVDGARRGDMLVVVDGDERGLACFGDVLGLKARTQGVAGVVVAGAVRDVQILNDLDLPVWSSAITPVPSAYGGYFVESVDEVVNLGNVRVCPGDLVIGDSDGVVVIPVDDVEQVLEVCAELTAREAAVKDGITAGRNLRDLAFNVRGRTEAGPSQQVDKTEGAGQSQF